MNERKKEERLTMFQKTKNNNDAHTNKKLI